MKADTGAAADTVVTLVGQHAQGWQALVALRPRHDRATTRVTASERTVAGRRVSRTYGPPPAGHPLPHAWAADQLGRTLGLATATTPLWGAAALPTLAYQAWA